MNSAEKSNPPCPCCNQTDFSPLIHFGKLPLSGHYLENSTVPVDRAELGLEFCASCAFVRKTKFPQSSRSYDTIDRPTSGQLPFYTPRILDEIGRGRTKDDFVLEIGSNDGVFLNILTVQGYTNLVGVEPSAHLAGISEAAGHRIVRGYFDKDQAKKIRARFGAPTTIVCRHTLEHVPDPLAFLQAARSLLAPGGKIYIELPNTLWILERLQIHEIWDEHENYFTPRTLELCLRNAGFGPVASRDQRHRDACNIACWAASTGTNSQPTGSPDAELSLCRSFTPKWEAIRGRMQELAAKWLRPAYVVGGAHNQANFVLFTGIGDFIDGFIDDADWKHGRFLSAPSPAPVITTSQFIETPELSTLLASAFPYPAWMEKIRNARHPHADVWVEPYPDAFAPPSVVNG